jgi:hypothetical protein
MKRGQHCIAAVEAEGCDQPTMACSPVQQLRIPKSCSKAHYPNTTTIRIECLGNKQSALLLGYSMQLASPHLGEIEHETQPALYRCRRSSRDVRSHQ